MLQRFIPQILTFLGKEHLGQNVYKFRFSKPKGSWLAGQHFLFILPHLPFDRRGLMRVFTISSPPEASELNITTRFFGVRSSSFKRRIFELEEGDKIYALGPSPILDRFRALDETQTYVFLVGGIGITPLNATLLHHLNKGSRLSGLIIYAGRDPKFIYSNNINKALEKMPELKAEFYRSPDRRIDLAKLRMIEDSYPKARYLITGSPRFVDGMYTMLVDKMQVEKRRVIADKFRALPFLGGGY